VVAPLAQTEAPTGLAPRAPQRLSELEREKQLVLKAIKEVQLDHQMRKISDPDYRDMIERYRMRAMRLISEIEAGDNYRELIERELKGRLAALEAAPAAAAEPEAAPASSREETHAATETASQLACPSCAAVNDTDAQFCKKCGAKFETA
jgi:hypothetical protein